MEMLSEDDRNIKNMTPQELARAWDLWFDLAQETNDFDPPYSHGVFVGIRDNESRTSEPAFAGLEGLSEEARTAASLLERLMSDVSEETWCAGWFSDLEYLLWDAIARTRPDWCSPQIQKQLRFLSNLCGGWIIWDTTRGRQYVPLGDWLSNYASWRGAKR
jgi:hypothetical protein